MAYRKKIISAGPLVKEIIYPVPLRRQQLKRPAAHRDKLGSSSAG